SVSGITKYLPMAGAGFLMRKEIEYLEGAVADPMRPFVAILGGAKVSGKIGVIENLGKKVNKVIIGGGMAFTFLKAMGLEVGNAKTILWNGPMGVFENDAYARGTMAVAHAVADAYALTIVGGADTALAVHRAGVSESMSFISTGGGAALELLEGKALPGIASLPTKPT